MNTHHFVVEIECDDIEEARQVMAERIGYDEDYGFTYRIDWAENGILQGQNR